MSSKVININETPFRTANYKRQNLWILTFQGIDSWLAKSVDRPSVTMGDGIQINFLTTYNLQAGNRGKWNPINIVLNDPVPDGQNAGTSKILYDKLKAQWDFSTGRVGSKAQYMNQLKLKLLQPGLEGSTSVNPNEIWSTQSVCEEWNIFNAYFQDVNFNGAPLDYDATERLTVSFVLHYEYATVTKPDGFKETDAI